jgi:hypothetical protein
MLLFTTGAIFITVVVGEYISIAFKVASMIQLVPTRAKRQSVVQQQLKFSLQENAQVFIRTVQHMVQKVHVARTTFYVIPAKE